MAGVNAIVWILVMMVFGTIQATREYESGRASDMMEGARVERMHPETSDSCVGNHCLQNSDGPVGAMWFGPRLGRRRRSDVNKLANKKIQESTIGEMISVPAWTIINGNERPSGSSSPSGSNDKRQETTFTPRLGRNLEDNISAYEILHNLLSHLEIEEQLEKVQPPPPLFAPRLGRNQFSPRLEHELRNLLRKLQM